MLVRNIDKVLRSKYRALMNSIGDKQIREKVKDNCIISGGAIVSLLLGEPVNDYDFYFKDRETCKLISEYFVKEWKKSHEKVSFTPEVRIDETSGSVTVFIQSAGVLEEDEEEFFDSSKCTTKDFKPVYLSSNAISLTNKEKERIQLIIRFYGEPNEIHKNYDFVHCLSYWEPKTGLNLNKESLQAILTKEIIYQGSLYPLSSIIRTRKFIQRGWHVNAGQYLKMVFQLNGLDLSDINVLEDQLVGVDVFYFKQLINYCRTKQKEDENWILDLPYLVEIIDDIFK